MWPSPLKSQIFQVARAMDTGHLLTGFAGLVVGWLVRDLSIPKPENPACHCHCSCSHLGSDQQGTSTSWFQLLGGVVLIGAIVASNAALALRVTLRNESSGQEIAFQVKGRQKGVYGAPKGLQLTD